MLVLWHTGEEESFILVQAYCVKLNFNSGATCNISLDRLILKFQIHPSG